MVGKRLPRDLAAAQTAAVGEGGEEYGVHGAALLEDVQCLVYAFVYKGDRARLDADNFLRRHWFSRAGRRDDRGCYGSGRGQFGAGLEETPTRYPEEKRIHFHNV